MAHWRAHRHTIGPDELTPHELEKRRERVLAIVQAIAIAGMSLIAALTGVACFFATHSE